MDYKSLLSLAEKNQELKDQEFIIKRKAKNGLNSGPNQSAIDAFKARKEKEFFEKERQRIREREKLMALRSQNSKSMKKAKMMKTRTKDNDFSRIILTEDQIEEQRRVEEKLKRKGTQDLTQNKKSMIELEDKYIKNGTKNLNKSGSHSSKNFDKSVNKEKEINNNNNNNKNRESRVTSNNENRKKKPKSAPPAMSYEQLLSLATEKSKSEKKSWTDELLTDVEEKKQLRPMTQKEKDRLKEEMYYKQRASKGLAKLPNPEEIRKSKVNQNSRDNRKDKDNRDLGKKSNTYESNMNNNKYINNNNNNNKPIQKTVNNSNETQLKSDKNIKNANNYNNNNTINQRSVDRIPNNNNDKQKVVPNRRPVPPIGGPNAGTNKSAIINKMNNRLNIRDKEYNERYSNVSKDRMKSSNNDYNRSTNKSINARARPPSPPPPPVRQPVPKLPPIGSTYRRGMYEDVAEYMDEDYEEEEDDDMSDFIDDGPEEKPIEEDYSRAIREIFGYDKRKYRNIDDDDIEEANFAQCMKEDARSARIGLLEDLEEERKEEEEKKQKALAKKRLK